MTAMAETTYQIRSIPGAGTFSVSIKTPDGRLSGASGFKSEADAMAWIDQRKRRAKADESSERQEISDGEQPA
jgi:hypothetical protein